MARPFGRGVLGTILVKLRFYQYTVGPALALGLLLAFVGVASGDDDEDELIAAFRKGLVLGDERKPREAVPYFEKALKLAPKVYGEDSSNTAKILAVLAQAHLEQGHLEEAEPLCRRCLSIVESNRWTDRPDYAGLISRLAQLYENMGQVQKAEPLYLRSLEIETKLGDKHPDLPDTLRRLASLYYDLGQLKKAESAYRRCLAVDEKKRGDDHPDVAEDLKLLATVCSRRGQHEEAERLYRRSLEIYTKSGNDRSAIAGLLSDLGVVYWSLRQYEKAETHFLRCLQTAADTGTTYALS